MQNYIPIKNDLKTYPIVGALAYEQMRFLRHDPHWYLPFDHEVKAKRSRDFKAIALGILCGAMMVVGFASLMALGGIF